MSEVETVTLRERVRERLDALVDEHAWLHADQKDRLVSAILREFRLQPVAWGRVTEGGEVEEI